MADAARIAPRLIVFSDHGQAAREVLLARFEALASQATPGRVLFSVRDYELPVRERWAFAKQVYELSLRNAQSVGLAERADLMRALSAQALHLPERGLSARDARAYAGPGAFLSRGSHEPEAEPEPELDARLLSPIFEPRKGRPALGLEGLERAQRAGQGKGALLFALGGVTASNAAACLAVNAAGVAVIGAALALDPRPLLSALGILRG